MKTATCFGLIFLAGPVMLANPAVSEINGKLGVMNGSMDSESTTSLEGSITWPVLESFGVQLDGLYSTMTQPAYGFANVDDADLGGVGGHFFWRDSETAMLGVEAGYVFGDPVDSWELGLEAEYYYKWLTIGGKAGVASINYDQSVNSIETDKDAFFCQVYLAAYPVDNLLVAAFVENRFDNTYFSIEVEYELPVPGLSVFANAMKGDYGYDHAFVGMRYYFGEDKPLKSRHRENDPRNTLTGIRHGIGTWQAEVHEQVVKAANQAPAGNGGSIGGTLQIGGQTGGVTVIGPGSGPLTGTGGSLVLVPTPIGGSGLIGGTSTIGGQLGGGPLTLPQNPPTGGTLTLGGGSLLITTPSSGLTLGGSGSTGGSLVSGGTGTITIQPLNPVNGNGILTLVNPTPGNTILFADLYNLSSGSSGVSASLATSDPSSALNWLFQIQPWFLHPSFPTSSLSVLPLTPIGPP